MAELHIIGQILKAIDFDAPKVYCRWSVQTGNLWKIIEGESEGQTAVCFDRLQGTSTFAHPLDLHFVTRGVQGWPKIHVEVYAVNGLDYSWPIGFGFVYLPTQPGYHNIEINTWKIAPNTISGRIQEKFWFGGHSLPKHDLIYTGLERYKLQTITSGKVSIEVLLIFRNFSKFGVEYK